MPELRREHGVGLSPLLVEAAEKIPRVYLLQAQADPDARVVRMSFEDMDDDKVGRLPFNRPSGSQSGAIGPVLKRSSKKGQSPPYGPSAKIQETTRKDFLLFATDGTPWGGYFKEITDLLFKPGILLFNDGRYETGPECELPHPLAAALHLISETTTVFVAAVDG